MTWETLKPYVTALLSVAIGAGGTMGVQAMRAPETKAPAVQPKTEVSCVFPLEVSRVNDRLKAVETASELVLEELRVLKNGMERRARIDAARQALRAKGVIAK